jgi:hypothetical protein
MGFIRQRCFRWSLKALHFLFKAGRFAVLHGSLRSAFFVPRAQEGVSMNIGLLGQYLTNHTKGLAEGHRLAYAAMLFAYSRYGWGDEEVGSADCSGAVCGALNMIGYPIRVTADALSKHWSEKRRAGERAEVGDLVFWYQEDGQATHVAVIVGQGVLLNARPGGAVLEWLADEVERRKNVRWQVHEVRFEQLRVAQERRGLPAYGVDELWGQMTGVLATYKREGLE